MKLCFKDWELEEKHRTSTASQTEFERPDIYGLHKYVFINYILALWFGIALVTCSVAVLNSSLWRRQPLIWATAIIRSQLPLKAFCSVLQQCDCFIMERRGRELLCHKARPSSSLVYRRRQNMCFWCWRGLQLDMNKTATDRFGTVRVGVCTSRGLEY